MSDLAELTTLAETLLCSAEVELEYRRNQLEDIKHLSLRELLQSKIEFLEDQISSLRQTIGEISGDPTIDLTQVTD